MAKESVKTGSGKGAGNKVKEKGKAASAAKANVKSKPATKSKAETKAKAEAKAQSASAAKAKAKAKPATKSKAETKAKAKAKAKPASAATAKDKSKPAAEAKAKGKTKPAAKSETIANTDGEIKRISVLMASPEVMPFAGTGGLGEVAGSLPAALKRLRRPSVDCRVILPLYGAVSEEHRSKMKFLGHIDITVAWRKQYMGIFELKKDGVIYYFVDNEYYFKRDGIYGHLDDCERFAYFSRAVMESHRITGFRPDIIHANDWQTALIPVYAKTICRHENLRTVFTVHNIEYQGHYGQDVLDECIGLDHSDWHILRMGKDVNLMKGAIECSDVFTTVSPTYARELTDPISAFGLDGCIRNNQGKMEGILNGINTVAYDPANDPYIEKNYDAQHISGKKECKRALQKELRLPEKDVPMLSLISRLVPPKGVDIVSHIMDRLLAENDIQFVMLGTGDGHYEEYFRNLQHRHPDKVVSMIEFDTAKAHKLYAAADIFLMPSRSEPCGLSQMIACRYGNAPIVRLTGGLADSIQEWDGNKGNGFTFFDYDSGELERAIYRALDLYKNKEEWEKLMKQMLETDFSWKKSARDYRLMYKKMLQQGE